MTKIWLAEKSYVRKHHYGMKRKEPAKLYVSCISSPALPDGVVGGGIVDDVNPGFSRLSRQGKFSQLS